VNILVQIAEPSVLYKPYIKYYKYIESDVTGIFKAIPITDIELYFNFTHINVFCNGYYNIDNPSIHLVGLQSLTQDGYTHMFGTDRGGGFAVVFQPQGFYQLFGIKGSDFAKYGLDGTSIFKKDIYYLHDQFQNCFNVFQMKTLFESHMSDYLKRSHGVSSLLNEIFNYIESSEGLISVSILCKRFNISPRSLQRRFKDEIGLSPMELLQIFRINKAIKMINCPKNIDLTEISYLSGYYDQSHFIRDIKKITRNTPGKIKDSQNLDKYIHHNRIFLEED